MIQCTLSHIHYIPLISYIYHHCCTIHSIDTGVAVDSSGNVYIADYKNYLIRYVSARTGVITTYAGNRVGASTGDLGPATSASVYPSDVAIDEVDRKTRRCGLGYSPIPLSLSTPSHSTFLLIP